jgi:hypothetical protein
MSSSYKLVSMSPLNIDVICDFLNTTQGLDKLYRLFSYFSKLISALLPLITNGTVLADSLAQLGKNLSHTRTVMRLVGLLHNFRLCKEFKMENDWKTFKGLTRILTNFTYLPCDHFAWMGREEIVGFKSETISWFGRTSSQSWLVGLIVEMIDLQKCTKEAIKNFNENLQMGRLGLKGSLKEMKKDAMPLVAKSLLIAGDFPLAVNYSLVRPIMSPLMVGICGTTSSLAALYLRWKSFKNEKKLSSDYENYEKFIIKDSP